MVSAGYLQERAHWRFHPCKKCGFSELFDAPSTLIKIAFPTLPAGAELESFTTFCPLCGEARVQEVVAAEEGPAGADRRRWWKFW